MCVLVHRVRYVTSAVFLSLLLTCKSWAVPLCEAASGHEPGHDFFLDTAPLHFEISVPTNDFPSLDSRTRKYVPVVVRWGTNAPIEAGFRLRGLSSFQPMNKRPAFALKLNTASAQRDFDGLSKLLFNNCANDKCWMREHLACSLFRSVGIPAARTRPVRVSINKRDVGVYLAVEAMNKDFLRRNFGSDSGTLYEGALHDIDRSLELDNGKDLSRSDVLQLLAAAREPNPAQRWEKMNRILDVDRFLKFAALQTLLGHSDGYLQNRNNYRIYHDPISGKMVFIPHGLDTVFVRGGDMTPATNSIVMSALYSIPKAQSLYLAHCCSLITNVWQVSILTNQIHQLAGILMALSETAPEYRRLQNCEGFLVSQIVGRQQEVLAWLSEPAPKPLSLAPGEVIQLTNWSSFIRSGTPSLFTVTNSDGICLRIDARNHAAAGWRSRAIVSEGDYTFSCRVLAKPTIESGGGSIPAVLFRLAGDLGGAALTQGGRWQLLHYRFIAPRDGRLVEFLCELQAGNGDIWIDLSSLNLTRTQ